MKVVFIITSILCLTFLRPLLLVVYPVIIFLVFLQLKLKFDRRALIGSLIAFTSGLLSMVIEGFFLYNLLVSLYLTIPTLLLVSARPSRFNGRKGKNYFDSFFKIFTTILLIVNLSAAIYGVLILATTDYPDDVFTGLYGTGGFGSHSLSVVNLLVAVYYFFHKKYITFAIFFVCGVLGFYGLGLFMFVAAFGIVLIPLLFKNVFTALKVTVVAGVFFSLVYAINPGNFDYIKVNIAYANLIFDGYDYDDEIKKMKRYRRTWVPRYITFLDGSQKLLFSDPKIFLLGTSPGTYNSRTAFYLNGDFIGSSLVRKLFDYKTTYHRDRVMPVLNRGYLENTLWNDGTRNQPFSSLVSIIIEYGVIAGGIILVLFFSSIRKARKAIKNKGSSNFVRFAFYYCLLLFLFQYYFEVIEIVLPIILMIKLLEIDQINAITEDTQQPT